MKNYKVDWLLVIVLCITLLALIVSCSTEKKAIRQTTNALIKYPAVVAKIACTAFPCIITKSDTLITYTDTTILVDCPTGNDFEDGKNEWGVKHDTLNVHDTVHHFSKVLIKIPFKTIDITQHIADSAQNKILQSIIDTKDATIIKLQATITEDQQKIDTKNKWIAGLALSILLSILGFVFKTLVKFK